MVKREPSSVTTRMFDVGFGDCMLVTFNYDVAPGVDGRTQRHMLVDFGSTRYPYSGFKLKRITESIAKVVDNKLDVLIVTHRHKDHLSGFGDGDAGSAIAGLEPSMVIRSWPDHPDAGEDFRGPRRIGDADRQFVRRLRGAHVFAKIAVAEFAGSGKAHDRALHNLADIGLANETAITNLVTWANTAQRRKYVAAGDGFDLGPQIPGAHMSVLGPPTLRDAPNLNTQRKNDKDEYWLRSATELADTIVGKQSFDKDVFSTLAGQDGFGAATWLVRQLERRSVAQLLRIVRSFDSAINNTSIVALISAGETSMLISGDAQIENWQHTLDKIKPAADDTSDNPEVEDPILRKRLANVSLYKVGHHGSRNGTPISMYDLWNSSARDRRRKMTILMSTKSGVHNHSAATAVPNGRLVGALQNLKTTNYYTTEDLRGVSTGSNKNFRCWVGQTRPSGVFGPFKREHGY